ncbi:MAG TPA: ABC transporter permease, partial [Mucilaginibacter sp.]
MARHTPSKRTWNAFKRNKLAMAGLVFIVTVLLVAISGYLLLPDDTPQANDMTIQLSIKKPGSRFMVLLIRKAEQVDTVGFWHRMFYGQPSFYREIPITGYYFKQDSIHINEYIGDEDKPDKKAFNIFEVVTGVKPRYHYNDVLLNPGIPVKRTAEIYRTFRDRIKNGQIITKTYWLGTDVYGRDLLSRLLLGTRISLSVGLMAVIISMLLGVTIGAIAGYFGGWIDAALSWLMNILWSLPALLLVIAISFALGKGLWQIFIAVGLSMWVEVGRLVRGQVMGLKQVEYIEAARALGFNNTRIITKHILPNITGPMLVLASSNFASAILLEAGLSFLGFGAQPP